MTTTMKQIIKLQTLKDFIFIGVQNQPTEFDQFLGDLIDDMTDEVAQYLDVRLGPPVTQESCILDGGTSYLKLPIMNVSNITIIVDPDRTFTDSGDIVDPSNYTVDGPDGIVKVNQAPQPGAWGFNSDYNVHGTYGQWGYQGLVEPGSRLIWMKGNDIVKATYDGGYDYTNLPGSLRRALIRQLAYNYKRMPDIGISSVNVAGTSITKYSMDEWLPDVKSILDGFRRITIAGGT